MHATHKRAKAAAQAMDETELEQVVVLKYLGRQQRNDNNDAQAIRTNLRKARNIISGRYTEFSAVALFQAVVDTGNMYSERRSHDWRAHGTRSCG